jgi:AAA+ superfamily predicted ATPase
MELTLTNLPDMADDADKSILRSRISNVVNDMLIARYKIKKPDVLAREGKPVPVAPKTGAEDDDDKTEANTSLTLQEPQFAFDQLVLEDKVLEELQYSIKFESVRDKIYNEWGLKQIDPAPKLALNFHGDSGTGKTMAAQALASVMGKKIILASYAEIESKYHGDGPKNVKKIFRFALENDAVLFIDEADSLLSKRLTNVTQGSEQAINSMRSQLLIEIEKFSGIVVFATNLAVNYDSAFITRIKSIHFKKPDKEMRVKLWQKMLIPTLPLASGISIEKLAEIDDICGRDIKNAVVKAATKTAINGEASISQKALEDSIQDIIASNKEVTQKPDFSPEKKQSIEKAIRRKLRHGQVSHVKL